MNVWRLGTTSLHRISYNCLSPHRAQVIAGKQSFKALESQTATPTIHENKNVQAANTYSKEAPKDRPSLEISPFSCAHDTEGRRKGQASMMELKYCRS